MKKIILIGLGIFFCISLLGCGKEEISNNSAPITSEIRDTETNIEDEPTTHEPQATEQTINEFEYNIKVIASILELEESDRKAEALVLALNTLDIGKIKEATLEFDGTDKELYITAEDGTHYKILLSSGNGLEYVLNIDTNEYVITSER